MAREAVLEFDRALDRLGSGKRLSDGVSAAAAVGDALWVVHDETLHVESLRRLPGTLRYAGHRQFALRDFVRLPADDEADLEGLAFDGECLWIVGSHAMLRDGAEGRTTRASIASLARTRRSGNRYLIARVPVIAGATLARTTGKVQAARLTGTRDGDALTRALRDDPHLGPFLSIPTKDNGFDIEGVAAVPGGRRLLLGLRGPVIDGWACVLDCDIAPRPGRPAELVLRRYRKHFLDLDGDGIRDLCLAGPDLIVLSGPAMRGKGTSRVRHWRNALDARASRLVRQERLPTLLELPYGEKRDHAEAIAVLERDGDRVTLLVLHDAASRKRRVAPASLAGLCYAVKLA